jgi:hypothetical protein
MSTLAEHGHRRQEIRPALYDPDLAHRLALATQQLPASLVREAQALRPVPRRHNFLGPWERSLAERRHRGIEPIDLPPAHACELALSVKNRQKQPIARLQPGYTPDP